MWNEILGPNGMQESRINRRSFLKAGGAASATFFLAGCSGDGVGGGGGSTGQGGSGPLKMGLPIPLSGTYSRLAQFTLWGLEIAQEDINNDGGINGREVEIITAETELDPGRGVEETQALIREENIDLWGGPVSSSVTLACIPVVNRNGVLGHTGTSAARQITGADCQPLLTRFRNHTEMQALAMMPFLREEGYETMSTLYADFAWGQSVNEWSKRVWEEEGGTVVSETAAPLGTQDFSSTLSQVDTSADVLHIGVAGGDAANLFPQAVDFGIKDQMQFTGVGGAIGTDLPSYAEPAQGTLAVNFYPQTLSGPLDFEGNRRFHERFKEKSDGLPPSRTATPHYEWLNAVKEVGDQIGYTGKSDNEAMAEELDGFEMEHSYQYPQGPKYIRGEDNQAMLQQYIVEIGTDPVEQVVDTRAVSEAEPTEMRCDAG